LAQLADRSRNTKNIITRLKDAYKSFTSPSDFESTPLFANNSTLLEYFRGEYSLQKKSLNKLTEEGYCQVSVAFSAITKIIFAQRNLNYIPYWGGKPDKEKIKTFKLDIDKGLFNLLTTGSCCVWNRPITGFENELEVIDTVKLTETYNQGKFTYKYEENGQQITINSEDLIICCIYNNPKRNTRFGIAPLEVAQLPIESIRYMYHMDNSILANKGSDILVSSGYNEPMPLDEESKIKFDNALNNRIKNHGYGSAITTGTKVEVHQLGRTPKEMALWEGYKIKTRDIAIVYQLNPALLGDPDSNSYSALSEAQRSLYNESVIPFVKTITENKQLKSFLGFDIFIDTSSVDVLQESQQLRSEKAKVNTDAILNLNSSVNAGTISRDIAIEILVSEWGFDTEEAQKVIIDKNTQSISTTDKVNVLSPIVATKVMESMTTNERRDLVGLQMVEGGESIPQPKPQF